MSKTLIFEYIDGKIEKYSAMRVIVYEYDGVRCLPAGVHPGINDIADSLRKRLPFGIKKEGTEGLENIEKLINSHTIRKILEE